MREIKSSDNDTSSTGFAASRPKIGRPPKAADPSRTRCKPNASECRGISARRWPAHLPVRQTARWIDAPKAVVEVERRRSRSAVATACGILREMTRRDRFRGALVGLAVGDAVGTTVEFKPPGTFEPVRDMVGGGPFSLPAGAWTDDTSMALCLAESLVERADVRPRRPARALRALVPRRALVEHRTLLRHRQRDARGARALRAHRRALPGRRRAGRSRQRPADEARAGRARVRVAAGRRDPLRGRERAHDARRARGGRRVAGVRARCCSPRCARRAPEAALRAAGRDRSASCAGAARREGRGGASPPRASRRTCAAAATSSTRSRPRCGRCAPRRASRTACSPRSTSATTRTRPPRSTASSRARSTGSTASRALAAKRLHRHDEIVAFADALLDLDVARPAIARFEHIQPARIVALRVAARTSPKRSPARAAQACRSPSAAAGTTSPGARRPPGC